MKTIGAVVMAVLVGLAAPVSVKAQTTGQGAEPEVLVKKSRPRARTRLYVRPLYPYRYFHSIYPLPYPVEYPGPNAHRECVDGYAVERRPSGTVITPRMRCRWAAGGYPGP